MSNICACVSDRAAAIVADSLSYTQNERVKKKYERTQKLFHVAGNIVAGVGDGDCVLDSINRLSSEFKEASPRELAERTSEITRGFNLAPEERFSLYFLGLEKKTPKMFAVSSKTSVAKELNPASDNYALDGAGESYMRDAIDRDRNRGFKISPSAELTELVDFMFDKSMIAPQSIHVNRELQFGLVRKEGVKILYDPDVIINNPPPEYLERDGTMSDAKNGKKGINDDVYKVMMAYTDLRKMLKIEYFLSFHLKWNNIMQQKSPEQVMRSFHELEGMTQGFLKEYLRCDYKNHRAWIEDEARDICNFAGKIIKERKEAIEAAPIRDAVTCLPETRAKAKYMAALR